MSIVCAHASANLMPAAAMMPVVMPVRSAGSAGGCYDALANTKAAGSAGGLHPSLYHTYLERSRQV